MAGHEKSIGHSEGLQRFLNSETFNELYKRVGKDRYTKSSLQDQLTRISGNEAVRNALARGDVDKIANILGDANAIQTAENTGRAFGIGSVGEAYNGGAITGQKTKQDWIAYSNFVGKYGPDAYEMSLKQGYGQGYVSGLATEYYGQALNGHIDPDLQKRVAQVNASEDGRQLWQNASSHTGRYASLTENEAANLNKYAAQAGFEGFEAQAGDGVTVAWGADKHGNLGVSSIHFDKSAGGREGQIYTNDSYKKDTIAGEYGVTTETSTLDGTLVHRTTDYGSTTTVNDNVINRNSGFHSQTDKSDDLVYGIMKNIYSLRGYSGEQLDNVAAKATDSTISQFKAGKEGFWNTSLLLTTGGKALGGVLGANALDGLVNDNNPSKNLVIKNPDAGKIQINSNIKRDGE